MDTKEFKGVIEDIVDARISKKGITKFVSAVVKTVNSDGSVDVYLPPDTEKIVSGVLNKTCERLSVGDSVELCTKNGKTSNTWVSVKHGTNVGSLPKFINYKDNTEVATDEYKNGKRVYAKKLVFTTELPESETTTVIAHDITGITDIWIDMGNSYFKAVDTTMVVFPLPILCYFGDFSDRVYITCDKFNLYFCHDTRWGTSWEKIILVKYTKD